MACTCTVICCGVFEVLPPDARGRPFPAQLTFCWLVVDCRFSEGGRENGVRGAGCVESPPPNRLEKSETNGISVSPPPRNSLAVLSTLLTSLPVLLPLLCESEASAAVLALVACVCALITWVACDRALVMLSSVVVRRSLDRDAALALVPNPPDAWLKAANMLSCELLGIVSSCHTLPCLLAAFPLSQFM